MHQHTTLTTEQWQALLDLRLAAHDLEHPCCASAIDVQTGAVQDLICFPGEDDYFYPRPCLTRYGKPVR